MPNATSGTLYRAGALFDRVTYYRNDKTPTFGSDPHGFLADPTLAGRTAGEQQLIEFLATGQITNPSPELPRGPDREPEQPRVPALPRSADGPEAGARGVPGERRLLAGAEPRVDPALVADEVPHAPDPAAIRRRLEQQRDEAQARIADLAKTPERGSAQGFGKRIGDGTTEAISRLTEIGVGTSLEVGLARTERALAKLDDGTYGICDSCGEPILPARLEAMPDSVLCVACARDQAPARPGRR